MKTFAEKSQVIRVGTRAGRHFAYSEWRPDEHGDYRLDAFTIIPREEIEELAKSNPDCMKIMDDHVEFRRELTTEEYERVNSRGLKSYSIGCSIVDVE